MNFKDHRRHWEQKVKVGKFTILASALSDSPYSPPTNDSLSFIVDKSGKVIWEEEDPEAFAWRSKPQPQKAAIGFYLSVGWRYTNHHPQSIFVVWKDGEVLSQPKLRHLVYDVVNLLEQGEQVEIACMGGHGRTGTLLACLIRELEGLSARASIRSVWNRYCIQAIETFGQIRMVYDYKPGLYGKEEL